MKSVLVLEDGTYFTGEAFGKTGEVVGEIVFNTCMTGYQEILTNPSYNGQIVAMTYPLIGNYGFNRYDNESDRIHVQGFIVKELSDTPTNWRCEITPEEYFVTNGIVGIKGIDTRNLTKHIRSKGSMHGIISTESGNIDLNKRLIIRLLMHTLFPEPVAPATRRWGILAISATTFCPDISFPKAKASFELYSLNSLESKTSFKNTGTTSLFGTSIPTAAFPGIGASILTPDAARFRDISSERLTIC